MSIITLFSDSHCHGGDTATQIARQLGYRLVTDADLVELADDRMTPSQLLDALTGPPPPHGEVTREKILGLAHLRQALAAAMQEDDLVYHGLGAQLVSQPLAHHLRIGLSAPRSHRLAWATAEQGWSAETAEDRLRADDARREWLTRHLHGRARFDWRLYDLLFSTSRTDLKTAVNIVVALTAFPEVRSTDESSPAARDFGVTARVGAYFTELGHDADVTCVRGHAHILVDKESSLQPQLAAELRRLALTVDGVAAATVKAGPRHRARRGARDLTQDARVPSPHLAPRPGQPKQHTVRGSAPGPAVQHEGSHLA